MPILDGFSATMRLKKDPRIQNIPIVTITALAEVESSKICGADACLQKPFDSNALHETIKKFID